MPVYEIAQFRGGPSDYEDKGIEGAFKFGANLDIRKVKDTLTAGQALEDIGLIDESYSPSASQSPSSSESPSVSSSPSASASPSGSESASQSPSASASPSASQSPSSSVSPSLSPSSEITNTFRDLVRFWVKCSDGLLYGFGNAGYIYRIDGDLGVAQVYKDPDGTIKGAEEKPSSSGKSYLYWFNDRKVKRKEIPGLSNWNDVEEVATNLTSAEWHTAKQVGGALYICNKSNLALVGYDDSYTNEALNLIPGNFAKTIVERSGRAIIGTARASDTSRGVNGAIDVEVPIAQVGEDGELFFANGSDSIPYKRFPGGGRVNPGGVANQVDQVNFFEWEESALSWIDKQEVGNMGLFAVYNADTGRGGVYTLGRKNKNHPFVLNCEYQLDMDELGAVTHYEGKTIVSYRDGSDFGVKAVDLTTKATGIYEGLDFKSPVKKPSNITTWDYVEIFCDPLPSGASIEFHYKLDKTGSFKQAKTADGDTEYDTASGKKAVFRIGAEGQIFEPRVVLNPSGNNTPEVHRIRTYFK